MPTAKKLPSGSWRCQVFSHYEYENGVKKKKYQSFTCSDPTRAGKKEAERMAAEWAYSRGERSASKTVHDAIEEYIKTKEGVLSPSTVAGYKRYLKNGLFKPIDTMSVRTLSQKTVQAWVSSLAGDGHSTKYIKNVYLLFAPAIKMANGPTFHVVFPTATPRRVYTPTDDEIKALIDYLLPKKGKKDDKYELRIAVMLAAFGSLRRSEVCALETSDFNGCTVTVNKALVRTIDNVWVTKGTKTEGSARTVRLPQFVIDMIDLSVTGRIVKCHPDALSNRFNRAVKFAELPNHFSFHSLRHYYVSIAHVLGIGDAYVEKMGGWGPGSSVMKRHYRETFSDVEDAAQNKLDDHFSTLVSHEIQHDDAPAQ